MDLNPHIHPVAKAAESLYHLPRRTHLAAQTSHMGIDRAALYPRPVPPYITQQEVMALHHPDAFRQSMEKFEFDPGQVHFSAVNYHRLPFGIDNDCSDLDIRTCCNAPLPPGMQRVEKVRQNSADSLQSLITVWHNGCPAAILIQVDGRQFCKVPHIFYHHTQHYISPEKSYP
jgi:hypothetical protein